MTPPGGTTRRERARTVGEHLTLLLVESDPARTAHLLPALRSSFGRVLEAQSGEVALYVCSHHAVDVVLTTTALPGMDAIQLCAELRGRRGPPVVVFLETSASAARAAWLEGGGSGCVERCAEPREIAARCAAIVRRTQHPSTRPARRGGA